ncbi:MAG: 23S rRNA (adenine(2030)-N(6))-methyltransferase RlmJ [Gammaproteobacteria bacterium]|jgi:23S rRNA (adenine2030-N6)-methyltransferase
MNYQHAFHAGNFADVAKHLAQLLVLDHLGRKPAPWCYLDTHAGAGVYDLGSQSAQRTGEWREGVGRLWNTSPDHPVLARWLGLIGEFNPDGRLACYPGSAALAAALGRPGDRLILCETESVPAAALGCLHSRAQIAVHRTDGYQAIKAFLPPRENRGLVLIDPPFEAPDEFQRAGAALVEGARRWRNGIFMLWYPLKDTRRADRLHAQLSDSGLDRLLLAEMRLAGPDGPSGFFGSGLLIRNPPWRLDHDLRSVWEAALEWLAPEAGSARIEWLVGERQLDN